ncbi:MAG: DUF2695 domain-containing protein [Candidatus Hermodarchaeota archaeon]
MSKKKNSANFMSSAHPNWKQFCKLLNAKLQSIGCFGDLSNARMILENNFPNIDIEKSLQYFEENGGFCDCEILLNIYDE